MNSRLRQCASTLLIAGSLAFSAAAQTSPAGAIDLTPFAAARAGGEFVEVNLHGSLLSLAVKVAEQEEPEVGAALRSVEAVRVNVISLNDSNRAEVEKHLTNLRSTLTSQGWERIVTVAQENGEDVGVYTKTKDAQTLAGLLVTVVEPRGQLVLVNVVGNLQPEKLAALGGHLGIPALGKAAKEAAASTQP